MTIVMTEMSENLLWQGRVWCAKKWKEGGVSINIKLNLPNKKDFNHRKVQKFICSYDCMIFASISSDP